MFKRIIIATDLSKDYKTFINYLGGLKVYGAEECLLLQLQSSGEVLGINNYYKASVVAELVEIFQNQKEMLEKQGYSVEARVLSGFSANEINRIALEEGYSAVVVDAQKHLSSGEIYFSGLADDLIHIAQKPVLLIRSEGHSRERLTSNVDNIGCEIGNHVLFPTDFSENADFAFTYLMKMAEGRAKKITLLHVQDKNRISPYLEDRIEEFNNIDNSRLQSMEKILEEKGRAEVKIALKYGSPSVEILKAVKAHNIQLVVMGSQGRGYVKEFFLGSVSHNIARNSPSSVLLIPAKR